MYNRQDIMANAWNLYHIDRRHNPDAEETFGYWLRISWARYRGNLEVEARRAEREAERRNGLGYFVPAAKEVWTPFGMKRI